MDDHETGWQTIESDAGLFTLLLQQLGGRGLQFEELYTLADEELVSLEPVFGLIFLFRFPTDQPYRTADAPLDGAWDHDAAIDRVFFATQTIQNACATQALLSLVLNQPPATDHLVQIGDHLTQFRDFAMVLPANLRGEALSNSVLIRRVHNSFARVDPFTDESVPSPARNKDDEAAFHYVAYVAINDILYELDGLQPAPISHGSCPPGQFCPRALAVLRRRVQRYGSSEIRFNLLAAVRDRRAVARDSGDQAALARELARRRDWAFENSLRRHNFVGFAGAVLTGVVAHKLNCFPATTSLSNPANSTSTNERYQEWIDAAKRRRIEAEAASEQSAARRKSTLSSDL